MPNRTQVLRKFYQQTIIRLEKESGKYKNFKEVIESFNIIEEHSREQLKALDSEVEK